MFLLGPLWSCGYRFTTGAAGVREDIRRVAIKPLRNISLEPGVEGVVTKALRRAMVQRGFTLEAGPAPGAAQVEGVIRSVNVTPTAFPSARGTLIASEYRLTLTLDLVLRSKEGGSPVWSGQGVSGKENFLAGSTLLETEANRRLALRRLSRELMGDAAKLMAEAF